APRGLFGGGGEAGPPPVFAARSGPRPPSPPPPPPLFRCPFRMHAAYNKLSARLGGRIGASVLSSAPTPALFSIEIGTPATALLSLERGVLLWHSRTLLHPSIGRRGACPASS